MTERDELARDIFYADRMHKDDPIDPTTHYSYVMADELIHAGYRKADRLQAALDAVLALHRPVERWLPCDGADFSCETYEDAADENQGTPVRFVLCRHCKMIEESPCEGECVQEAGYRESLWPCPTVAAINTAREGRA